MKRLLFCMMAIAMLHSAKAQNDEQLNVPPGTKTPSTYKYLDLSYKLELLGSVSEKNNIPNNILGTITPEEMESYKTENPALYDYYIEAENYYNNLSTRVKSIYTVGELWEVYCYDQKLKDQLSKIR